MGDRDGKWCQTNDEFIPLSLFKEKTTVENSNSLVLWNPANLYPPHLILNFAVAASLKYSSRDATARQRWPTLSGLVRFISIMNVARIDWANKPPFEKECLARIPA